MKKILGLTIAALLIIGMAGTGTWAYFSDTETSSGNTFTAGTLDLKVSNDAATYADGVTSTWGGTNCKPGDSWSGTVTLRNSGSVTANHVEIKFVNTVTDVTTPAEILGTDPQVTNMSAGMTVSALTYGGANLLAKTATVFDNLDIRAADTAGNADGIITLNELNNVKLGTLTSLAGLAQNGTSAFAMTTSIAAATGNGIQGDSVVTVVTFGLFQDASQHLP